MSSLLSSLLLLLLLFSFLSSLIHPIQSQTSPRGLFINCGSTITTTIENRNWVSDTPYINSGNPQTLTTPNLVPILSTLRSFPISSTPTTNTTGLHKFCYVVPVFRNAKYMIRTTYYYGGANSPPPVFDQIVDGTVWGVVNTTEDYSKGLSSYYEGVFLAKGKTMSVCVGANTYTDSDPFISALEFIFLDSSVYNTTRFDMYGLSLVARNSFGYGGPTIKYPDDPFDRYWEPYGNKNPIVQSTRNISVSSFWNLPPSKVFDNQLTTDQVKPLELQWPPLSLPTSVYYIALYFADSRDEKSRVFNVTMNGIQYYRNLNATSTGVAVFSTRWPLSGLTNITLTPAAGSDAGPVINAGELFNLFILGGRTLTRDVIALERLRDSLTNTPVDWHGDPCLPRQYSWTGITCSEGSRIRVVTLNLTSMGLSGSIADSIGKLTALTDILFANNNLSGPIPDLSSLKRLQRLHLENNNLSGELLPSLGTIDSLQEVFVQSNNLTGEVPNSLRSKSGLNLIITPGNSFSLPPAS